MNSLDNYSSPNSYCKEGKVTLNPSRVGLSISICLKNNFY
jgi:hypothetical protein